MSALKTGNICPCCGKPIITEDPIRLALLAAIGLDKGLLTMNDFLDTLHESQRRLYRDGDPHA